MSDPFPLAFAVAWTVVVLGAGGWVTEIGDWYRALRKPPWQPPDALFGPAWTLIFVCASAAFVLAWRAAEGEPVLRAALVAAYLLNGALNFLWSWLFFRMRRPDVAAVEVAPLWMSIAAIAGCVALASPPAALLLAPYLGWVSFAAVLNRAIVRLNGPFA